ncbi:HAMP domain-containing histidine kinase [Bacillus sp. H-16]|uniref:sensor histidine kinase n=1 Tax=Alteribacter salitolerans TaxID=2912333 RepID=UPI0019632009|nr:HAMP domain-containing sensor histidine kinase [Alteribacter salitolerans]MBM7094284.1 HAMP domain-containing histidine kinase [Alteribacter salitolerans]
MKLSHRITLYSTVTLLVLLLIVNTSIYFLFHHYTMNAELDRAMSQARTVVEAMQTTGNNEDDAGAFIGASVPEGGMIRVVRENSETPIAVTKNIELNGISPEFSPRETTEDITFNEQAYASARSPVIWTDGSIASLELIAPMNTYEETLGILRVILLISSIVILIPSFFAARALSRFILLPVQNLVQTMNQIREEGSFKKIDIDERAKDELAMMGHSFNHMIDLLKKNFDKQKQFVSDASHELKTPLTVICSYARLLKRWGMERPEVLEEAVNAIDSESRRMKEMTNQMLALASGETEETLQVMNVDLCRLTSEIAKKLGTAYQRQVDVQCSEEAVINGDEGKLNQLLFILIDNGLKYSEEGLTVNVKKVDGSQHVEVRDFGIGIPEEDLHSVFERFFRVDKARTRKTGGTGLGLSIAMAIAKSHKGTIKVESEEGKGSVFTLILPEEGLRL